VGASARLSLSLEAPGVPSRPIWSRLLAPGDRPAREEIVPLAVSPGTVVRLGFRVEGERGAWVVLKAPRLVASGPTTASLPTPLRPGEDRRAETLRAALGRANVVLVILDAARADHFGCYGYPTPTTPEIDRIAAESIVFEQAYTPAVYTLAAMSSVWTSLQPDQHHAEGSYDAPLSRDPLTLAELLGSRGIRTAGWVANGFAGPAFGLDRGFAEFHEVFRKYGNGAEAFAKVVPQWLASAGQGRFFAYLHFREPHFPLDPPEPFTTRFGPDGPLPKSVRSDRAWVVRVNARSEPLSAAQREHLVRLYDGNLAFADQEVGALRRSLEAAGLWERTVLIIAADHGEALLEHGYLGHNVQLYEASAHVPLIVRLPRGSGRAGIRVRSLVDLLDLAPTVADVFGLASEGAARGFRGRSLLEVAAGAAGATAVFTRTAAGALPSYAVRDERFTFVRHLRFGTEQLFDRSLDPGEQRDLAGQAPVEAAYYRQLLHRWLLGLGRRAEAEPPAAARLTPEQRENLRALGYLQ
jgi:arylsulfatase A-like enzyme